MNTRKIFALLTVIALLFSCVAFAEEEAPQVQTGVYTVINKTGEELTKLSISDNVTGETNDFLVEENDVLAPDSITVLYFDIPATENGEHRLTLSYKTASGREESFGTLSIEEATIDLLAADAMTGATPIAFSMQKPEQTGVYTLYNYTGEVITHVNFIDNEDGAVIRLSFKDGFDPKESYTYSFSVPAGRENVTLTLQFVTESGKIGIFNTLKIEEAPIYLLDVDSVGGATPLSFTLPE